MAAALSTLVSCRQEIVPGTDSGDEDGTVTFDMTVSVPGANPLTKALGGARDIRNIYVAVFGMNHYLNEFVQAIPLTKDGSKVASTYVSDGSGNYKVRVTLSRSSTPRYVHVVANVSTPTPTFGYENDVMDKLESDEGDGYWQYVEFPSGIEASTTSALNNVKLVRDFAWIGVQLGPAVTSKWDFQAYQVCNTPDKGLFPVVTSEDDGSGNHVFSADYATWDFQQVIDSYGGRMSPVAALTPATIPDTIDESVGTADRFVYENKVGGTTGSQVSGSTFIILRLRNKSTSDVKYFRVDLENRESGYVPILRNFHYRVTVSGIGIAGYDTASEAANHPTRSDIFTGVDISQLTELSDGISNLKVSFAEKVFTQAHSGAEFSYRFTPDLSGAPGTHTKGTLTDPSDDTVISSKSADWSSGGTIMSSDPSSTDYGWYKVSFDVAAPGSTMRSSTFSVTGENTTTGSYIMQTIKVITMPLQSFENVSVSVSGKTFTVSLELPEGLPQSMFPLDIMYEQPDAKIASAQIGVLTELDGALKFYKEVTWKAYQASRQVLFEFRAIKPIVSGDVLKIRDKRTDHTHDYYFSEVSVSLYDYEFATDCSATKLDVGLNQTSTFTFDYVRDDLSPVTVTLTNLEPADSETKLSGSAGTYTFTPSAKGTQSLKLKSTTAFSDASIAISMDGMHTPEAVTLKRPDSFVIATGAITIPNTSAHTPNNTNSGYLYVLKEKTSSTSASKGAGVNSSGQPYVSIDKGSYYTTVFKTTEKFTVMIKNFSGDLETAKVWFRLGSYYTTVSLKDLATNRGAELKFND